MAGVRPRTPELGARTGVAADRNPSHPDVGSGTDFKLTTLGWQVLALRSARLAGVEVSEMGAALDGAGAYLDRASADATRATYAYLPGHGPSLVMTAEGLLCRQILGWPRDAAALRSGCETVAADLPRGAERNIYYWYYAAQLLHNQEGELWERANPPIRDALVEEQAGGGGCDRGSWDPARPRHHARDLEGGRHFVTAPSLLTLEVYVRYLPVYRANPVGQGAARAGP